jgi:hypothetical protein
MSNRIDLIKECGDRLIAAGFQCMKTDPLSFCVGDYAICLGDKKQDPLGVLHEKSFVEEIASKDWTPQTGLADLEIAPIAWFYPQELERDNIVSLVLKKIALYRSGHEETTTRIAQRYGFSKIETGGGCDAFEKEYVWGKVMITESGDPSIPDTPNTQCDVSFLSREDENMMAEPETASNLYAAFDLAVAIEGKSVGILNRHALETAAKKACPTESYYLLCDCIDETSDEELMKIIQGGLDSPDRKPYDQDV